MSSASSTNMKIIDLSQPLYDGMPVYPGDPEVRIKSVLTVEKDEWAVQRIEMVTHDGTHVNVPRHIAVDGKTLSQYDLSQFMGAARVYDPTQELSSQHGIIFVSHDITIEVAEKIASAQIPFVGLSDAFDFNLDAERFLLNHGVISFERLANTEQLPDKTEFMFFGIPLNITDADGSPVRAFAKIG